MSDVLAKRQIDTPGDQASKRQEPAKAPTPGRRGNKPGRKPLETEPKNKRTAQNRAAQRAFRERKERKMKELEEKISTLEDEKKSASTESEFLRLQVQILTQELAKHRGTADLSDLNIPTLSSTSSASEHSSQFSPNGSESTLKTLGDIVNGEDSSKQPQFAFEFPWSRKGSVPSVAKSTTKSPASLPSSSTNNAPTLASDESTTCSSESSPFDLYTHDDHGDLPLFNKVKTKIPEQEFNFNEHFDEGVSDFCSDLNTACGNKQNPIPQAKAQMTDFCSDLNTACGNKQNPIPLAKAQMTAPVETLREEEHTKVVEDPLSFLNESSLDFSFGTFDPTLAFANDFNDVFDEQQQESDPLSGLVSEESAYDPFGMFTDSKVVERRASKPALPPVMTPTLKIDEASEVVPSHEGKLMKCTEIWDRITSHPKYADIDIDGLCSELRSKAKCSDKGVVIDYADVSKMIQKNIQN
jgi:AP-1-like factor